MSLATVAGLVKARGGSRRGGCCRRRAVCDSPSLPPSITSRCSPTPSTRCSNTNSPPPSTEGGREGGTRAGLGGGFTELGAPGLGRVELGRRRGAPEGSAPYSRPCSRMGSAHLEVDDSGSGRIFCHVHLCHSSTQEDRVSQQRRRLASPRLFSL